MSEGSRGDPAALSLRMRDGLRRLAKAVVSPAMMSDKAGG